MSQFLKIIRVILPIVLIVLGVLLMTTEFAENSPIPHLMMVIGVFYIFDAIHTYKQNKNG